ncbi:MAG: hypothetical protein C0475_04510 [Planctomyces sp.]|nr:hypothetical protein [Planctomyces sp.]
MSPGADAQRERGMVRAGRHGRVALGARVPTRRLLGLRARYWPGRKDQVAEHLVCPRCAYDMVGLPVVGRCPECGTGVLEVVADLRLHQMQPGYLRALAGGAAVWAVLLPMRGAALALWVAGWVSQWELADGAWVSAAWVGVVGVLWSVGAMMVGAEPAGPWLSDGHELARRRVVRHGSAGALLTAAWVGLDVALLRAGAVAKDTAWLPVACAGAATVGALLWWAREAAWACELMAHVHGLAGRRLERDSARWLSQVIVRRTACVAAVGAVASLGVLWGGDGWGGDESAALGAMAGVVGAMVLVSATPWAPWRAFGRQVREFGVTVGGARQSQRAAEALS